MTELDVPQTLLHPLEAHVEGFQEEDVQGKDPVQHRA